MDKIKKKKVLSQIHISCPLNCLCGEKPCMTVRSHLNVDFVLTSSFVLP